MAEIIPFRGMRYDTRTAGNMTDLICPPYDVITPSLQKALYEVSQYNAVRLELPAEHDPYAAAAGRIDEWLGGGALVQDEGAALYPYFQTYTAPGGEEYIRKGFFCALRLHEFAEKQVLPHERTLSGPKKDRMNLFRQTRTNISGIFGLYADPGLTADVLIDRYAEDHPPLVDALFQGVRNRLWKITSHDLITRVQQTLLDRQVYIADGHHRYETGVAYRALRTKDNPDHTGCEPYNFILAYLANIYDEGLMIFPLHRMVCNLDGFDPEKMMVGLEQWFDIQSLEGRDGLQHYLDSELSSHVFGVVLPSGVYGIRLKQNPEYALGESVPEVLRQLGVVVLHDLVFGRILGISLEAMQRQSHLAYTEDEAAVFEAVMQGDVQAGFIVKPTTLQQVREISQAGEVMPQKSTYFYPKIMTGLVMHRL